MTEGQEAGVASVPGGEQRRVLRNAAWLVAAQVAAAPISVLVNALVARSLGAAAFGWFFLAATLCSFGFLAVDWGQSTALPALVASDRRQVGELLGTALGWRAAAAVAVYGVLALGCLALGYGPTLQAALALTALGYLLSSAGSAIQDAIRGFERTDVAAWGLVGQQLLGALLVIPALLLGGGLVAVLAAQAAAAGIGLSVIALALRPLGVGGLALRRDALRRLFSKGTPFLFLGVVLALQGNVDAVLLASLASPEVVGWHAVARKLVGALLIPANALITVLYPTLHRLWEQDRAAYFSTARAGLRAAAALAVPAALGCALFPELGVLIFGRASFRPAEDNLRLLSAFVLLVYFSMTLGCSLSAAGRQRAWAFSQLACVAVSAIADPLLIPWFQARGNGGLGVCAATVASEVLMLGAALGLAPRGLVDRALLRSAGLALLAGGAMALTARLLAGAGVFVAAPLALTAWAAAAWSLGVVDPGQLRGLRELIARRLRR